MRHRLAIATLLVFLGGCAGDLAASGDPPAQGAMEDLEPAGPADAVLESEVEE